MARELKYTVAQYGLDGVPERLIVWYLDTDTQEEGNGIYNRSDMVSPQSNTFDNFKTMVERFMSEGGDLKQAVVQYSLYELPERMITQFDGDLMPENQVITNRVDMGSPDKQIFDNFKQMIEQHFLN